MKFNRESPYQNLQSWWIPFFFPGAFGSHTNILEQKRYISAILSLLDFFKRPTGHTGRVVVDSTGSIFPNPKTPPEWRGVLFGPWCGSDPGEGSGLFGNGGLFFLGGGVVAQVGQKKTWVSLRYWKKQRLGPVQKLERAWVIVVYWKFPHIKSSRLKDLYERVMKKEMKWHPFSE